ncbi:Brix-domain-containing protein [Irpex rosettiformis]|uniref:Brix-domain-containing protein n=1 Tax=Irpex rosettiformis TaxID=378272 RepID=A0ACB8UC47_9APHY|nr:Brix-domain-containing protein [Irpex rosettiformis]
MPTSRFEPSTIKNKMKREEIARKLKKQKGQSKLQKRLAQAKVEADNPAAKKRRQLENVLKTLDNMREYDPSILTANPAPTQPDSDPSQNSQPVASSSSNQQPTDESAADISADPFASYFSGDVDPTIPPKVLVTTSQKATRVTYEFCEELVSVFPGAELIRRKKGKGFEMGRIAGWAAGREYTHLMVVNEDMKKPNAVTIVYLPHGPTAYFKLSSIELTQKISGHARPTAHFPELVMNGFVTRLGHTVGRMFQTLFPPMPEFQGRQVVTLHNQRDFLFFRRHRYAFRSVEKVQLQEIGPRFTLKLRSLRKGLPAVKNLGEISKNLEFDIFEDEKPENSDVQPREDEDIAEQGDGEDADAGATQASSVESKKVLPPKEDEYVWMWKPELETTRRTFFL